MNALTRSVGRALEGWQAFVLRHAVAVLAVALLATIAGAYHVVNHIRFNTDTADMLAESLPWRATYLAYERQFPQYSDTIAVVIDGRTPDEAQDAAARLVTRLRAEPRMFPDVYAPQLSQFMQRSAFLYLDLPELEDLADELARMQPFLARLVEDPSLRGLAGVLAEAVDALTDGDTVNVGDAFARIAAAMTSVLGGAPVPLSWQEMMSGRGADSDDRRVVISVTPTLDYSRLLPGETAINRLRGIADELALTPAHGVSVRLTGGAAMAYEELQSVSRGAERAGALAFVMVAVILVVGLRSAALVATTLVALVTGLTLTATFASIAIGELNLISVAFAVLYIGLGVDYAIHYVLRYQELLSGLDRDQALAQTSTHTGRSLALCTLTTAVGFYAFIPTDYTGVAELGLISGTGMIISLAVTLTVVPAMLRLLPVRQLTRTVTATGSRLDWPLRYPAAICVIAAIVAIAAAVTLPALRFDHNPIHLQDPTTESVRTYEDLVAHSTRSPLSIVGVAPDGIIAAAMAHELAALPEVDSVMTVADFVPSRQDAKLAVIDDIALSMGLDLQPVTALAPPTDAGRVESLRALQASLRDYRDGAPASPAAGADALARAVTAILRHLETVPPDDRAHWLFTLEQTLLAGLPGRIEALRAALQARAFDADQLPAAIRSRWVSAQGGYRVEVFPRDNLDVNAALEHFVGAVRAVMGEQATDTPVINVEASRAVVAAFVEAFAGAAVVIALILYLVLRSIVDTALVLTPLLLAGLLTGAATVLLDLPFNFANVIALPLLLGIGVDNGIHILHRFRSAPPADGLLLRTGTARAVVFSALTTIASFGNLALSTHRGTASMGVLLSLGIGFTLLATLVLLPSLLQLLSDRRRSPA
ncbi:MAG: MMPL family transporter [Gammaproteobacteria bacterium]|nr:MMPL family transporter [Gammaproteobacteria bacterium]